MKPIAARLPARLLALVGLVLLLGTALASPAQAQGSGQPCTHLGKQVTCPPGVKPGTNSAAFNADGSITWGDGRTTPAARCCTDWPVTNNQSLRDNFTPKPVMPTMEDFVDILLTGGGAGYDRWLANANELEIQEAKFAEDERIRQRYYRHLIDDMNRRQAAQTRSQSAGGASPSPAAGSTAPSGMSPAPGMAPKVEVQPDGSTRLTFHDGGGATIKDGSVTTRLKPNISFVPPDQTGMPGMTGMTPPPVSGDASASSVPSILDDLAYPDTFTRNRDQRVSENADKAVKDNSFRKELEKLADEGNEEARETLGTMQRRMLAEKAKADPNFRDLADKLGVGRGQPAPSPPPAPAGSGSGRR
ncbi:MAG: hypothetical protein IT565_05165 [Rhodospirillales bacterium]|nr:hypothetical protein [Rhodospirillales bacterium]